MSSAEQLSQPVQNQLDQYPLLTILAENYHIGIPWLVHHGQYLKIDHSPSNENLAENLFSSLLKGHYDFIIPFLSLYGDQVKAITAEENQTPLIYSPRRQPNLQEKKEIVWENLYEIFWAATGFLNESETRLRRDQYERQIRHATGTDIIQTKCRDKKDVRIEESINPSWLDQLPTKFTNETDTEQNFFLCALIISVSIKYLRQRPAQFNPQIVSFCLRWLLRSKFYSPLIMEEVASYYNFRTEKQQNKINFSWWIFDAHTLTDFLDETGKRYIVPQLDTVAKNRLAHLSQLALQNMAQKATCDICSLEGQLFYNLSFDHDIQHLDDELSSEKILRIELRTDLIEKLSRYDSSKLNSPLSNLLYQDALNCIKIYLSFFQDSDLLNARGYDPQQAANFILQTANTLEFTLALLEEAEQARPVSVMDLISSIDEKKIQAKIADFELAKLKEQLQSRTSSIQCWDLNGNHYLHVKNTTHQKKIIIVENGEKQLMLVSALQAAVHFDQHHQDSDPIFAYPNIHTHIFVDHPNINIMGGSLLDNLVISAPGAILYRPSMEGLAKHFRHEPAHCFLLQRYPRLACTGPFFQDGLLYSMDQRADLSALKAESPPLLSATTHKKWVGENKPFFYSASYLAWNLIPRASIPQFLQGFDQALANFIPHALFKQFPEIAAIHGFHQIYPDLKLDNALSTGFWPLGLFAEYQERLTKDKQMKLSRSLEQELKTIIDIIKNELQPFIFQYAERLTGSIKLAETISKSKLQLSEKKQKKLGIALSNTEIDKPTIKLLADLETIIQTSLEADLSTHNSILEVARAQMFLMSKTWIRSSESEIQFIRKTICLYALYFYYALYMTRETSAAQDAVKNQLFKLIQTIKKHNLFDTNEKQKPEGYKMSDLWRAVLSSQTANEKKYFLSLISDPEARKYYETIGDFDDLNITGQRVMAYIKHHTGMEPL